MKITISKISPDFKTIVTGLFEDNETVNDGGVLQGKQIMEKKSNLAISMEVLVNFSLLLCQKKKMS